MNELENKKIIVEFLLKVYDGTWSYIRNRESSIPSYIGIIITVIGVMGTSISTGNSHIFIAVCVSIIALFSGINLIIISNHEYRRNQAIISNIEKSLVVIIGKNKFQYFDQIIPKKYSETKNDLIEFYKIFYIVFCFLLSGIIVYYYRFISQSFNNYFFKEISLIIIITILFCIFQCIVGFFVINDKNKLYKLFKMIFLLMPLISLLGFVYYQNYKIELLKNIFDKKFIRFDFILFLYSVGLFLTLTNYISRIKSLNFFKENTLQKNLNYF